MLGYSVVDQELILPAHMNRVSVVLVDEASISEWMEESPVKESSWGLVFGCFLVSPL